MTGIARTVDTFGAWWALLEKRNLSDNVNPDDPVVFWREKILFTFLFTIIVLAPFAIIPAVYLCILNDLWILALLDIIAYFMTVLLFYRRNYTIEYRAGFICLIFFCLGTGIMFILGPSGNGYVWLFGASVLGGAMIGLRAGLIILSLNCFSFLSLIIFVAFANPYWVVPDESIIPRWIVRGGIFLMLNSAVTIIIAMLLRGMEAAFKKEKAYSDILRKSEERYRLIADNSTDVIWTMNIDKAFTYISPSVFTLRGYTTKETKAQRLDQIVTPATYAAIHKFIEEDWHRELNSSFSTTVKEFELRCRDGSTVWGESTISAVYDSDGSFREIQGVTRNISDRKRAEKARRESEERLRAIFEAAKNVAFIITDTNLPDIRVCEASPGAEIIYGYSGNEFQGKSLWDLYRPEDFNDIKNIYNSMGSGYEAVSEEKILLRKNGEHFPALHSTFPLQSEDGSLSSVLCVSIDISDQKMIEQRLVQTEKMAVLGGLVAGLVHELSTPLGVALMSASFLMDKTESLSDSDRSEKTQSALINKYLATADETSRLILSNIRRTVDLINSFKQVAVDQTGDLVRVFQVKGYIHDIIQSLRPKIRAAISDFTVDCPDELIFNTHPGALYQVLSNLILNSQLHGFRNIKNGKVKISVGIKENSVVLDYFDNGKGINEEIIEKIFDPFFTTSLNNGGSGLGLNIVKNIVKHRFEGDICCVSQKGAGVHFKISIPKEVVGLRDGSDLSRLIVA